MEGEAWFEEGTLVRVFPYIVPRSWVDSATREALVVYPFSDELFAVLVVDGVGAVRNVRPQDLESVGIDESRAFAIAAENLTKAFDANAFEFGFGTLRDGTSIGMSQGSWMAPAGGLLFGNFHQMLVEKLGGDRFVAIAPNQETLIAFVDDERARNSAALRSMVEEQFTQHRKPVSRAWLEIDGSWPRAYSGTPAF